LFFYNNNLGLIMLNTLRLSLAAALMALFVVACGESTTEETTETAAPAAEAPAAPAEAPVVESTDGLTKDAAIAQYGEPTVSQSYSIDSLTVDFLEWHTESGVTAIQFQNGEAKFTQSIPAAE
jgi:hypothetical protein